MYMKSGESRPRVPVRVARHGPGAIGVYLWAHGHDGQSVADVLAILINSILSDISLLTPVNYLR